MNQEGQEPNRFWRELDRLRTRVHNIESSVIGLKHRADNTEKRLGDIEETVDHLETADAIAEGVAKRLEQNRETTWRKYGIRTAIISAVVAGIGTIADLIFQLLRNR